jgi:hypothetical protein
VITIPFANGMEPNGEHSQRYRGGSWAFSSYVLQASSSGSFSNSNSDQETLRGSHGTMSNQDTSYRSAPYFLRFCHVP